MVAPFRVAERGPGPRDRLVIRTSDLRARNRAHNGRGDRFDCEWASDTDLAPIELGLVVQGLPSRRFSICDGARSHVCNGLVLQAAANAFVRVGKLVVVI